jgi:sodium transport system permease protein
MRWSNVFVIFRREVRDQVRDRRTLFMIFVLPMLLYPILGIGIAQLSVAFEQKPKRVVVVGAESLPDRPALLNERGDGFEPGLFDVKAEARLLRVTKEPRDSAWRDPKVHRALLREGRAEAVVLVPPDIRERIEAVGEGRLGLAYDSADEGSLAAGRAVREVLSNWNERIVRRRLQRDNKPESYVAPVHVAVEDVATPEESGGSVWARLFPFLLVMMSLTGAFYPAIDLCAGEKERGTMETLLISPASRAEIVVGKFLTVVLASVATALLNLVSMGLTASQMASSLAAMSPDAVAGPGPARPVISPPSWASAFWMILLLIPLSVFFSAVCLALAVLARSMKEGQYYMTPLYVVALPLIFATLAPGIELNLFTSLVPITGVSLLLRALMQADYATARRFFLPVLVPIIVYGVIALRWAVDQFRRESVLFREAERFDLRDWLHHLIRDREPTPNAGLAVACFSLMLTSAWFLTMFMASSALGMIEGQLAFILGPPLVLALLLTSSPRRTFRLFRPRARYVALAVGLALALNPLVNELRLIVDSLFPAPEFVKSQLGKMMEEVQKDFWLGLLVLAVVPAFCEEAAFRGFILSGFQRDYRDRSAIILSSLLFGFLHVLLSLFQQLFNATLLGLVLGLLAVRSGSLLPGVIFHFINNAAALLTSRIVEGRLGRSVVPWLYRDSTQGLYHWHWVVAGAIISALLLFVLYRDRPRADAPKPAAGGEAADLNGADPADREVTGPVGGSSP